MVAGVTADLHERVWVDDASAVSSLVLSDSRQDANNLRTSARSWLSWSLGERPRTPSHAITGSSGGAGGGRRAELGDPACYTRRGPCRTGNNPRHCSPDAP